MRAACAQSTSCDGTDDHLVECIYHLVISESFPTRAVIASFEARGDAETYQPHLRLVGMAFILAPTGCNSNSE